MKKNPEYYSSCAGIITTHPRVKFEFWLNLNRAILLTYLPDEKVPASELDIPFYLSPAFDLFCINHSLQYKRPFFFTVKQANEFLDTCDTIIPIIFSDEL